MNYFNKCFSLLRSASIFFLSPGMGALQLASAGGHTGVVRILLSQGAQMETRHTKTSPSTSTSTQAPPFSPPHSATTPPTLPTAVMFAALHGQEEVMQLLLDVGASTTKATSKTGAMMYPSALRLCFWMR